MEQAFSLDQEWKDLVHEARVKDYMLIDVKKHFSKVTMNDVEKFKIQIKELYGEYKASGPGSAETTLDEGLDLLE